MHVVVREDGIQFGIQHTRLNLSPRFTKLLKRKGCLLLLVTIFLGANEVSVVTPARYSHPDEVDGLLLGGRLRLKAGPNSLRQIRFPSLITPCDNVEFV